MVYEEVIDCRTLDAGTAHLVSNHIPRPYGTARSDAVCEDHPLPGCQMSQKGQSRLTGQVAVGCTRGQVLSVGPLRGFICAGIKIPRKDM